MDAVAALKLALDRDAPGTFNIVGEGVLPVSTIITLAGRMALPVPHFLARPLCALLWAAHLYDAPPQFLHLLKYLCVADGRQASRQLGFVPAFSTREAVMDFGGAMRLRDARLVQEAAS
jgi:UDP-glucose 4-epimerase